MGELFRPHTNTKRWLVGISVGIITIAIVASSYFVFFYKPAKSPPPAYNPLTRQIKELESQTPPVDPLPRALYYGQLAQSYQKLHDTNRALKAYLQAQAVIDNNHLTGQYVFYQAIADAYLAKQDKTNARLYLEKQVAYLKAFEKDHPGVSSAEAIKAIEEQIKAL